MAKWGAWQAAQIECPMQVQPFDEIAERRMKVHAVGLTSWLHPAPPPPGSSVELGFNVSPDDVHWAPNVEDEDGRVLRAVTLTITDPGNPGFARVWSLSPGGGQIRVNWEGTFLSHGGAGPATARLQASDYFMQATVSFEDRAFVNGIECNPVRSWTYQEPRMAIRYGGDRPASAPMAVRFPAYLGQVRAASVTNSLGLPFSSPPVWTGDATFGEGLAQEPTASGTGATFRFWSAGAKTLEVQGSVGPHSLAATASYEVKDYFLGTGSEGPGYGKVYGAYTSDLVSGDGWNTELLQVDPDTGDPVNLAPSRQWLQIDRQNLTTKSNVLANSKFGSCSPNSTYPAFVGLENEFLTALDWRGWRGGIADCPRPNLWEAHMSNSNCHGLTGHVYGLHELTPTGFNAFEAKLGDVSLKLVPSATTWGDVAPRQLKPGAVLRLFGGSHSWVFVSGPTYAAGTFFANNANLKALGLAAGFAEGTVAVYQQGTPIGVNDEMRLYEPEDIDQ
jgi:hypothetical protein